MGAKTLPRGCKDYILTPLHMGLAVGQSLGMVASSCEFQTKVLRKNLVPDEYKLYRAALD